MVALVTEDALDLTELVPVDDQELRAVLAYGLVFAE